MPVTPRKLETVDLSGILGLIYAYRCHECKILDSRSGVQRPLGMPSSTFPITLLRIGDQVIIDSDPMLKQYIISSKTTVTGISMVPDGKTLHELLPDGIVCDCRLLPIMEE